MDNFKFNFLSRGQLESSSLDKFLLAGFKTIICHEVLFGNLIFAIVARMLCRNHLKSLPLKDTYTILGMECRLALVCQ